MDHKRTKLRLKAEDSFYKKKWSDVIDIWNNIIENYPEDSFLIGDARLAISISKRLLDLNKYKSEISDYRQKIGQNLSSLNNHPKIAIYTVINDRYDSLKLPEKIDPKFEYIVFSDRPISGGGIWQVRPILCHFDDPVRTSRFIKLHPHQLLKEFDIAIYMDSNLMLLGDISALLEKFLKSKMPIGGIKHPFRKSVYEEIDACILLNKDHQEVMQDQIDRYRKEKFHDEFLLESNFHIFDLKNKTTHVFLNNWWKELEDGSRRDQLSFNYALMKTGANFCSLLDEGYTTRNSPLIAWVKHDSGMGPAQKLIDELNFSIEDPLSNCSYSSIKENNLKEISHLSIEVIVCIDKNSKSYRACLESINHSRNKSNHHLMVIDNSSNSNVGKFLTDFSLEKSWVENISVKSSQKNHIDFINYAFKKTKSDFVIFLDADTIVSNGWVEKMADSVLSTHGAGITSPLVKGSYSVDIENSAPNHLNSELDTTYENLTPVAILPQVGMVSQHCFGVLRKVIDDIGYFDSVNFDDKLCYLIDYCFRASDSGFLSVIATHTCITKLNNGVKYDQKSAARSTLNLQKIYSSLRINRAMQGLNQHPVICHLKNYVKMKMELKQS